MYASFIKSTPRDWTFLGESGKSWILFEGGGGRNGFPTLHISFYVQGTSPVKHSRPVCTHHSCWPWGRRSIIWLMVWKDKLGFLSQAPSSLPPGRSSVYESMWSWLPNRKDPSPIEEVLSVPRLLMTHWIRLSNSGIQDCEFLLCTHISHSLKKSKLLITVSQPLSAYSFVWFRTETGKKGAITWVLLNFNVNAFSNWMCLLIPY